MVALPGVKAEASGKHECLRCCWEGRFRLIAATELWQACDRFVPIPDVDLLSGRMSAVPLKPETGWIAVRQTT